MAGRPGAPPSLLRRWRELERVALRAGDPRLAAADLAAAAATLAAYAPQDREQAAVRDRILAFVAAHPDALHRSCGEGHLTGSALVVDERARVLLTHHRKLDRWLQLGGHCDGDGNLAATALREAVEESGIRELAVVPRILDLDVHAIPAHGAEPEHLHLDVRYLVLAPHGVAVTAGDESHALRWFRVDQLETVAIDASLRRLVGHLAT